MSGPTRQSDTAPAIVEFVDRVKARRGSSIITASNVYRLLDGIVAGRSTREAAR